MSCSAPARGLEKNQNKFEKGQPKRSRQVQEASRGLGGHFFPPGSWRAAGLWDGAVRFSRNNVLEQSSPATSTDARGNGTTPSRRNFKGAPRTILGDFLSARLRKAL